EAEALHDVEEQALVGLGRRRGDPASGGDVLVGLAREDPQLDLVAQARVGVEPDGAGVRDRVDGTATARALDLAPVDEPRRGADPVVAPPAPPGRDRLAAQDRSQPPAPVGLAAGVGWREFGVHGLLLRDWGGHGWVRATDPWSHRRSGP